jgi:hypothetical protein
MDENLAVVDSKKRRAGAGDRSSKRVDEKRTEILNAHVEAVARRKREFGGALPYGYVTEQYNQYMEGSDIFPDLKQHQYAYRVHQRDEILSSQPMLLDTIEEEEEQEQEQEQEQEEVGGGASEKEEKRRRRGGRPAKVTEDIEEEDEMDDESKAFQCRDFIVKAILEAEAKEGGKKANRSAFIRAGEDEFGLKRDTISSQSISYRLKNGVASASKPGPKGIVEGPFEELLATTCLAFADHGQPLNNTSVLELANDMIAGSSQETAILEKKGHESNESSDGATLGVKWLEGFKSRYRKALDFKFPQLFDERRAAWTKYENFELFYNRVDAAVLECKLGVRNALSSINGTRS